MKTRTLLLLAVTCGLAILVAGTVLLLRVSGGESPRLTALGVEARAGDARATLLGVDIAATQVTVQMRLGGVDDPNALDGFTMFYTGGAGKPVGGTCAGLTIAMRDCTIVFDNASVPGTSRLLVWERAGDEVRWGLGSERAPAVTGQLP